MQAGFLFGLIYFTTCGPVLITKQLKENAMTATILHLLPDLELQVIQAFLEGKPAPHLASFFNDLEIPTHAEADPVSIALAKIILYPIQDKLPNWYISYEDGSTAFNRASFERTSLSRLNFNPKLALTVNWADSGPGFSWPESYYVTYFPSLNVYIVTASRDGDDAWGCSDHAIGHASGELSPTEAAKACITAYWQSQQDGWDQPRWAYLFDEGLIDTTTADAWAEEIWSAELGE